MSIALQDEEGVVTTLDETRHGLSDGDYVTFTEIQGMEALNNAEPRKITVKGMQQSQTLHVHIELTGISRSIYLLDRRCDGGGRLHARRALSTGQDAETPGFCTSSPQMHLNQ